MPSSRRLGSASRVILMGAGCCWLIFGSVAAMAGAPTVAPMRPFPQHVPYVSNTILPSHRTRPQLDADVAAAWTQWKARHLATAGMEIDGRPRYRVKSVASDGKDCITAVSLCTVSEAQGYGMLLAAFLAGPGEPAAREIFDGLFEFSADHPSLLSTGRLFDWNVPPDEAPAADPTEDDSAFDGDADIAYALLLADQQWGSGGTINYRARALDVIAAILQFEIGPTSHLPLLGDWIDPLDPVQNEWTPRTSDFMTGHFRVFGEVTGIAAWAEVRVASLAAARSLHLGFAPATGLLPDFTETTSAIDHTPRPASPNFLESPSDGDYFFNAGRVPWRLGQDALLSGDETAWDGALAIAYWARGEVQNNPLLLHEGYTLAGLPIDAMSEFNPFFAAPIGVASMLDADLQPWLNATYDAVRESDNGYYADSVSLLSMVVMTGNWWEPLPVPEPSALAQGFVALVAFASLRRAGR